MIYEATIADVIDRRIADLGFDARWYRDRPNPRHWRDLRIDADRERRALLRLRRIARILAESRPDPLTESKRYDSWTETELRAAAGDR